MHVFLIFDLHGHSMCMMRYDSMIVWSIIYVNAKAFFTVEVVIDALLL